ncbi:unnamed protein product [Angiostrongylus costaricensis]|uniref:SCP domain-containing protein n=1 Tax=Angiostrongylus costaricensis TaxID=334426 RepID=A0A0R3PAH4_ANGCS|nr:unnamed protein product [Angiostrongylus costaricensis]
MEFYNIESNNVTSPIQPTTAAPVQSTTGEPFQPTTEEPLQPTSGEPFQPTTEEPLLPTTGEPFQPTTEEPLQPTTSEPFQPATCEPPRTTTGEPLQPTTGGSLKPTTSEPLQPGTGPIVFLQSLTAKGLAENPLGTNKYAPKAARMLKMVYDCKVEESAAKHANKCEFKHSSGSGNGENIWVISTAKTNLTDMATRASKSWFDELVKHGVPPDNKLTNELWIRPKMAIGHYTQVSIFKLYVDVIKSLQPLISKMVWEGSYKLGCGVAVCPDKTLVVCQYSPPGNYIGGTIYTIGDPCKSDGDCKCDGCKCSQDEALCIKPN